MRNYSGKVRIGLIGTSWYSDISHLNLLKSHPGAVTAAICGRNRVRAEEMALKYAIPTVYTDYRDMIQHGHLDAVVIATPDDMHYPMVMAALDAGLHVLCEKPLAFNLAQAREMLAKAESAGVKHMVCFTNRWMPQYCYLQRLVAENHIGKVYNASFNFTANYARHAGYHWKWDCQHGLGALGDLGSHMIDMAIWMVGDIARVQASLMVRENKAHPEGKPFKLSNDVVNLTLQFTGGAVGAIYATEVAHLGDRGRVHQLVLHGEKGTLELESDWTRYTLRGIRDDEKAMQPLAIPENIMQGVDQNTSNWEYFTKIFTRQSVSTRLFIDSILADIPITPSFRDGVKVQAVIEAAFESDRTGCWADVEQLGNAK